MKKYVIVCSLLTASLLFTACSQSNSDVELSSYTGQSQSTQETQTETVVMDNLPTAITELKTEDLVVGTGAEAKKGAVVTVHYTGVLLDGTKFDSSLDRGTPFSFGLGDGMVIAGWDEGVVGMKVGGKRRLHIPANMAYGERGVPPVIPPNAPLVFDVELLEVQQ